MDVITIEDGAGWLAFLRSLIARGLSGVQPVISDDLEGLKAAIESVLTGTSWAALPDPCHAQPAHP